MYEVGHPPPTHVELTEADALVEYGNFNSVSTQSKKQELPGVRLRTIELGEVAVAVTVTAVLFTLPSLTVKVPT